MADKWTVALFGHWKPKDLGWERRAMPGDVIAYKPIEREFTWTETERKEFLIATIVGTSARQMEAMVEPQWDTDSYRPYSPETFDAFVARMLVRIQSKRMATVGAVHDRMVADLERDKEKLYADYVAKMRDRSRFPIAYLKKRRIHCSEDLLKSLGVDIGKMLDRDLFYNPKLPAVEFTDCTDKLRERNILATDGLNIMNELTDLEIEAKRV